MVIGILEETDSFKCVCTLFLDILQKIELLITKAQGLVICGGDFNLRLNSNSSMLKGQMKPEVQKEISERK